MNTYILQNEKHLSANNIWARIDSGGKLFYFDNRECRRLSSAFGMGVRNNETAMARLCTALLDRLAKEFDHILRERADGGGTMGDMIREFSVEEGPGND